MEFSSRELSLIGASLYLCEGTKKRVDSRGWANYSVEFTNIDPRVIKLFLKFLRKVIKVKEDKIKAELFIYPDHKERVLIDYWSNLTKIPTMRFHKTIFLRQKNIKFKPNPLGILKIRCFSKKDFIKIQSIINRIFGEERVGGIA